MKENFYLDDGTYSASQIVIEMVRAREQGQGDVSEELLKKLKEPADSQEFRLKLRVSICTLVESMQDRMCQTWSCTAS